MKNRILHRIKDEKASVLFEAVIILPIVFILLFALILLSFRLHERTTLDGAAKRGVIFASKIVSDPQYLKVVSAARTNDEADQIDLKNSDYDFHNISDFEPYRYFGNKAGNDSTESLVTEEIKKIIKRSNVGWNDIENVKITYKAENKIIYQDVVVEITASYDLPAIFGAFGLDTKYEVKSRAAMSINDPDEFVRNADFATDLVREILEKTKMDKKIQNITKAIKEKTGRITEFVNKFFK